MSVKIGEQYFNDALSAHYGHQVVIAQYTDAYTGLVTDYHLDCEDCEDPVGIAVEVVSAPYELDKCDHSSVVVVNLLGETTCLHCGKENK